jgi:putative ABC transport system permease protein
LAPPGLPRLGSITMDGKVYLFLLIVVALASLIFGVAPALAASRTDVHRSLKEGSRSAADSTRRRRIRGALVISEFAMALVLLVGAGLVIKSFLALMAVDAGFDPRNTVSMKVSVRGTSEADPARRLAFFLELVRRVKALPGVNGASAINHVPLNGDDWQFAFDIDGRSLPLSQRPSAHFLIVHPGYFATMGIPMIMGRDFTSDDVNNAAHVVIVSRRMARRYWSGQAPIGQRISVDDARAHPDWFTIVGVAKEVTQGSWSAINSEEMYFPTMEGAGYPWNAAPLVTYLNPLYMTLVVRAAGDAASMVVPIEALVASMDRDVAVSQITTMEAAIAQQFTQPRFYLLLLGAFAASALVLSAVGVYGVISYSVARRTHEIGVRMALGAERQEAFRMVIRQGLLLAGWGGLIGLLVAVAVTRYLGALLYAVQPTDVATFVVVTIVLAVVAFVACCIPARHAASVNPMEALRYE